MNSSCHAAVYLQKNSRKILSFLCCLALFLPAACAPRQPQSVQKSVPVAEAESIWAAYEKYASERDAEVRAYRINSSLRFGKKGSIRRVTMLMWSNGDGNNPIRLDVMAGINVLVMRMRETPNAFLALDPRNKKARTYKGKGKVCFAIGSAVPFGLSDFSALLRGRFHDLFGMAQGKNPVYNAQHHAVYILHGARQPGTLELRHDGLPIRWEEKENRGWVMTLDYDESAVPLPQKITLQHPDGRTAILLVKNRETLQKQFTADQLALQIPQGTQIDPIRQIPEKDDEGLF